MWHDLNLRGVVRLDWLRMLRQSCSRRAATFGGVDEEDTGRQVPN